MNKKYFEDNGEEAVNRRTIGTGPYMLVEHVPNDQIFLEGIKNHWRRNPGFELVRVIEVPEQATRIAMFNADQTDITLVGLPLLDQVLDKPGARTVIGKVSTKTGSVIHFGGNWQTRREGNNNPAVEKPWVGNPDVPGDLERAVNIRRAMSYAIDRETLNEVILGGQGCVGFLYGIDTCSAHWNPEWGHPFDVEMARQLLADGGFPDGFEVTFWTAPGPGGQTKIEVDEAIVPFWEAIGLDVTIDNSAYQVRRPQFISERSMTDVWSFFFGGNVSDPDVFLDMIPDMTYGRVLSNLGYDYPEADTFADELQRTFDLTEAWKGPLNDYFQFNSHLGEMFAFGTIAWIDPWVVGPRIGPADMIIHGDGIPELESLVPAR
jgi:ABC-type transport system substrate-binding protein